MFKELLQKQRNYFHTEATKSYEFRMKQLNKLYDAIVSHEDSIIHALYEDLGKSTYEAYLTEIGVVKKELKDMMKHLKHYMKPRKVKQNLALFKATSKVYHEPYGNVLIIAPWNYPFQLALSPLIGALAAGNTAIIKVSEYATHTEKVIKTMIQKTFESQYVEVVTGGVEETQALLNENFDYIFFTGSPEVGKIIMRKASDHLTPVTLELGGKSPAIIHDGKEMYLIAKRIAYGKFINAGQTCIAPDYIWVKEGLKEALIESLKNAIESFYGNNPLEHPDYPKIISEKHYQRLLKLIDPKKVIYGGQHNHQKISPTLCDHITWDDQIMQDEIFGPILPIMTYQDIDEVIDTLKCKDKPLALYLFTEEKKIKDQIIQQLSFGGATINDTLMHFANENIPFGGVGKSGMGAYHGKHSFYTFTHNKGVVDRSTKIDLSLRYLPGSKKKANIVKKILK